MQFPNTPEEVLQQPAVFQFGTATSLLQLSAAYEGASQTDIAASSSAAAASPTGDTSVQTGATEHPHDWKEGARIGEADNPGPLVFQHRGGRQGHCQGQGQQPPVQPKSVPQPPKPNTFRMTYRQALLNSTLRAHPPQRAGNFDSRQASPDKL